MEITTEQIEKIKNIIHHPNLSEKGRLQSIEDYLKEILPKAFEPEYIECALYGVNYREKFPDTGNWRIFSDCKSFYVVHKDLEWAIGFEKDGNMDDWDANEWVILKKLRERKSNG